LRCEYVVGAARIANIAGGTQNLQMKDIADLRKSYEQAELDEAHSASSPLPQFEQWLHAAIAAKLPEPTAMTLATVGPDGRPSTRVVLLKSCDPHGLVFYTNYKSRKARELTANPHAALQFHWVDLERVVRIEGRVGAWASPQSEVIPSRVVLVTEAARIGAKFLFSPPRPPHWGGYRLVPDTFEFWQGRKSRLHDRLRYTLQADGAWLRQRLAP
jgi:pyridoxamine 5'-phosphate oxidase